MSSKPAILSFSQFTLFNCIGARTFPAPPTGGGGGTDGGGGGGGGGGAPMGGGGGGGAALVLATSWVPW